MTSSVGGLTASNCLFGKYEVPDSGLQNELILEIFRFLDIKSLAGAARSCKKLQHLSQNVQLWKYLCIRDFFQGQNVTEEKNWREFYKAHIGLNIPFPGEPGVFRPIPHKNWKPYYSKWAPLCRELVFVNENSDCVFRKISLLGYEDGAIAMSIDFSKNKSKEKLCIYLQSIEPSIQSSHSLLWLQLTNKGYRDFIVISDLNLIKKFFKVISTFHTLPEAELTLMRKVIWAENWKNITPLSEKDMQDIESGRAAYEIGPHLTEQELLQMSVLNRLPLVRATHIQRDGSTIRANSRRNPLWPFSLLE
jgi:hypothetical protein